MGVILERARREVEERARAEAKRKGKELKDNPASPKQLKRVKSAEGKDKPADKPVDTTPKPEEPQPAQPAPATGGAGLIQKCIVM